jgi:hypothetical protein
MAHVTHTSREVLSILSIRRPGFARPTPCVFPHQGRKEAKQHSIDDYWCLYDGLELVS